MKYTFVGDVHGKVEAVREALSRDGQIIFVGDFIDSFDKSIMEHDECYRLVIDAIEKKKARAIYGNHELSYLMHRHRCSGWTYERGRVVNKYEGKIRELFEPHIFLTPEFLVSHAGLSKFIWDKEQLSIDLLPQILAEWWHDESSPAHWIGKYRGGLDPCGGLFWCDFNVEFQEIPELTQVFGHTAKRGPGAKRGIRQTGNSYCIDCLDREQTFLTLEV